VQSLILLISDYTENGCINGCINELQTVLAIPIVRVATLRSGLKALKETDSEILARAAGLTPVLELDLMATPPSILVRKVRSELNRFATKQFYARNAAIAHLRGELRDSLTGLLLESQLALREVDASRHPKLVSIVQSAMKLCARLKLEAELTSPHV
jgi:hypothetical protein